MRPVIANSLDHAQPVLRPVAQPVDTYVRPAPRPTPGAALLGALSKLEGTVRPILEERQKQKREEQEAEGEQLFLQNQKGWADAIRSGTLPAGASPHVRMGYRRALLNTMGSHYASALAKSLEQGALQQLEDPAEIEAYLGEFYNKFLEENDLSGYDPRELQAYLTPMVERSHAAFRNRQAEKNIEFIEQGRWSAFENEMIGSIDNLQLSGGARRVAGQTAALVGWIETKVAELDAEGLPRDQIGKRVTDIIALAAESRENLTILSALDSVRLGTGPLSGTLYARERMAQARDRIISAQEARENKERVAEERARSKKSAAVALQASKAVEAGDYRRARELMEGLDADDHATYRALSSVVREREKGEIDEVESGVAAAAMKRIQGATSEVEAQQIFNEVVETYPTLYKDLVVELDRFNRRRDDDYQRVYHALDRLDVDRLAESIASPIRGNPDEAKPEMIDRAERAKSRFMDLAESAVEQYLDQDGRIKDMVGARRALRDLANSVREEWAPEGLEQQMDANDDVVPVGKTAPQRQQDAEREAQAADPIKFELAGKTRNQPLSEKYTTSLRSIVKGLGPDIGLVVTSAGQHKHGEGPRTGSSRHDVDEFGEAHTSDFTLTRNGKKVTPREDPKLYVQFIEAAAAAGHTGIGHYDWGIHVGNGSPAFWGPDKTAKTADPVFAAAYSRGRGRVQSGIDAMRKTARAVGSGLTSTIFGPSDAPPAETPEDFLRAMEEAERSLEQN